MKRSLIGTALSLTGALMDSSVLITGAILHKTDGIPTGPRFLSMLTPGGVFDAGLVTLFVVFFLLMLYGLALLMMELFGKKGE